MSDLKMTAYIVKRITEADFGCEGIPDGGEMQAELMLRSEDGEEITVTAPDKELYEKHINEGDWVRFDIDGKIIKED